MPGMPDVVFKTDVSRCIFCSLKEVVVSFRKTLIATGRPVARSVAARIVEFLCSNIRDGRMRAFSSAVCAFKTLWSSFASMPKFLHAIPSCRNSTSTSAYAAGHLRTSNNEGTSIKEQAPEAPLMCLCGYLSFSVLCSPAFPGRLMYLVAVDVLAGDACVQATPPRHRRG
eukprot:1161779-Pelagomonas_calceolata.AAC.3